MDKNQKTSPDLPRRCTAPTGDAQKQWEGWSNNQHNWNKIILE